MTMTYPSQISYPRLFAEGTAIIISILLAFSIDAWWDDRQDRTQETELLLALKSEFQLNLLGIESALKYRNAASTSIDLLFEAAAGQSNLEAQELDSLLGNLAWSGVGELSTGVMDGALQSGNIRLLQNAEFRALLAGLPALYDLVFSIERSESLTFRDNLMPFLFENAYVPQIANSIEAMPGSGVNSDPARFPIAEKFDHSGLLQNRKFLGIITLKRWDHVDAIWAYGRIQSEFERAIRLIDQEIAN